jgi:hypothetical protein
MSLDASGNLGIGTSSPTQKLHLAVASAAAIYGRIQNSAGDCYLGLDSSGNTNLSADNVGNQLIFKTIAVERMRLDAAGNLGLGVTPSFSGSAYKSLESFYGTGVAFDGNNPKTRLFANAYNNGTDWLYKLSSYGAGSYQVSSGTHQWFNAPSGTAGNAITFTQAMTLDASGNLGIGTSSPQTKLDILSANTATDTIGNAFIRTSDTQAADVGGKLTLGGLYNGSSYYAFGGVAGKKENSTSGNVAGYLQFLTTTSAGALTERMRLDSSGNLIQSAPTTPPSLTTNGTMVFNLTSNICHWISEV